MDFFKKNRKLVYTVLAGIGLTVAIRQVSKMGLLARIPMVGNGLQKISALV